MLSLTDTKQTMLIVIIPDPDKVYREKSTGRLQLFIKTFPKQFIFLDISGYHLTILRASTFLSIKVFAVH